MDIQELAQNKEFLKEILAAESEFPHHRVGAWELAAALMSNLKSTDAELRDDLSYSILERILRQGLLAPAEVEQLLHMVTGETYLYAGIGDAGGDSVFTRSFSILVIAAIIEADAEHKMLSADHIHQATRTVLDYARRERDYRGFVDGKGWAHAVAHTADALDSCAHHAETTLEQRLEILDVVAHLATAPQPLAYNEDERLAFAVYRIIQGEQVPYTSLQNWVKRFHDESPGSEEAMNRWTNAQRMLRCLYFLVYWNHPGHPILEELLHQLKHLNVYYRYGILPMA